MIPPPVDKKVRRTQILTKITQNKLPKPRGFRSNKNNVAQESHPPNLHIAILGRPRNGRLREGAGFGRGRVEVLHRGFCKLPLSRKPEAEQSAGAGAFLGQPPRTQNPVASSSVPHCSGPSCMTGVFCARVCIWSLCDWSTFGCRIVN